MKALMVEYKVKKEKLDEVKVAIKSFVKDVHDLDDGVLYYESFVKPDGVSFVHFMSFFDDKARKIHEDAHHTKEFVKVLYPACESEPVFTDLEVASE